MNDKIKTWLKDYGPRYTAIMLYDRFMIKYVLGKKYFPMKAFKKQGTVGDICVSIIVPMYNTPVNFAREMLESVKNQTYINFELVLVDASDDKYSGKIQEIVKSVFAEDSRINYLRVRENRGIADNTNIGVEKSKGSYIALLDHDDLLHPDALYHMVRRIEKTGADFLYSDELSFEGSTDRVQSINLKPEFSPALLRSNNYICHFTMFKRDLIKGERCFRSEYDGSQDYDLFLRLSEKAKNIQHIDDVLYYWRIHAASVAAGESNKNYAAENGRKALEAHLDRMGLDGICTSNKAHPSFYETEFKMKRNFFLLLLIEDRKDFLYFVHNEAWRDFTKEYNIKVGIKLLKGYPDVSHLNEGDVVLLLRKGYRRTDNNWIQELIKELTPENVMACGGIVNSRVRLKDMKAFEKELNVLKTLRIKSDEGISTEVVKNPEKSFDEETLEYIEEYIKVNDEIETEENYLTTQTRMFGNRYEVLGTGLAGVIRILPTYAKRRTTDPGYMNRCIFTQNTSVIQGGAIAMKAEVFLNAFKKIKDSKEENLFSENAWLYFSFEAQLNNNYAVVTPKAVFARKKVKKKEKKIVIINRRLFNYYGEILNNKDRFYNSNFRVFGKFYRV